MNLIGMSVTEAEMQKGNAEAELWSCHPYAPNSSESTPWIRAGVRAGQTPESWSPSAFCNLEELHGQPRLFPSTTFFISTKTSALFSICAGVPVFQVLAFVFILWRLFPEIVLLWKIFCWSLPHTPVKRLRHPSIYSHCTWFVPSS